MDRVIIPNGLHGHVHALRWPGRERDLHANLGMTDSTFCLELEASIPRITEEWKRLTDRAPWNALSAAQWRDHLPPLLHALIQAAICNHPDGPMAREKVVLLATAHGEHRRDLGFTTDQLLEEQQLMRMATWTYMSASNPIAIDEAASDIIRIDAAIGVATVASLMGFHRAEVTRGRDWSDVLADLVARWEHTGLTEASAASESS